MHQWYTMGPTSPSNQEYKVLIFDEYFVLENKGEIKGNQLVEKGV